MQYYDTKSCACVPQKGIDGLPFLSSSGIKITFVPVSPALHSSVCSARYTFGTTLSLLVFSKTGKVVGASEKLPPNKPAKAVVFKTASYPGALKH